MSKNNELSPVELLLIFITIVSVFGALALFVNFPSIESPMKDTKSVRINSPRNGIEITSSYETDNLTDMQNQRTESWLFILLIIVIFLSFCTWWFKMYFKHKEKRKKLRI